MKKILLVFALVSALSKTDAQLLGNLVSVYPNSAAQGQTLTTTITQPQGSFMIASPPCDPYGIFLVHSGDTIFSDSYNINWPDALVPDFTIPSGATLGFYDVYTYGAYYDPWWFTCTTIGYYVMYSGFEVTQGTTGFPDKSTALGNPAIEINAFTHEYSLSFSNREMKKYKLSLLDVYGREVYSTWTADDRINLNRAGLSYGVFFYRLEGLESSDSYSGKFLLTE
jgi:hypothetical protein